MKKVLIATDNKKKAEFESNVETARNEANRLIDLFHTFQDFFRIKTIEDFEKLVNDPIGYFDEALQTNVNIQATGGKKMNPKVLAELLDIERDEFIGIVKGHIIDPSSCRSCSNNPKIIKTGTPVLSYQTYFKNKEYLIFDGGSFSLNEDAIAVRNESFKIFAETEQAIQCWDYWQSVIKMLNSLNTYCSMKALQDLMNGRVVYLYDSNRLVLNEEQVINEVINLNSK